MEDLAYIANTTKVAGAVANTVLLAQNPSRRCATIYNDSSAVLYVKLGPNATADDWTVKLNQDDYFETPHGYVGEIDGIWTAATGQARVSEGVA